MKLERFCVPGNIAAFWFTKPKMPERIPFGQNRVESVESEGIMRQNPVHGGDLRIKIPKSNQKDGLV